MEIITPQKQEYFISRGIDNFFISTSTVFHFVVRYCKDAFLPPYEFKEIIRQCYQLGVKSLGLITVTGLIIGIVFTKQSRPALIDFGATSWLPSLIGIAVIKALAPLVTAIICAGKIGSGIGAELGSMKVTEQIDAMEVSASNPYKYLVVTRVTASTLMTPLLMLYTAFVGLLGSFIDVQINEQISLHTFVTTAFEKISFLDVSSSVIRATVYGFTIGMVSCYKGFTTTQGTEGVGKAANSAVVTVMYLIFIEEAIIIQIFNWLS